MRVREREENAQQQCRGGTEERWAAARSQESRSHNPPRPRPGEAGEPRQAAGRTGQRAREGRAAEAFTRRARARGVEEEHGRSPEGRGWPAGPAVECVGRWVPNCLVALVRNFLPQDVRGGLRERGNIK